MDPQWQFNPLLIPLSISTLVILALIAQGIRRRRDPVAGPYLVFMVCLLIWILTSLLELATLNLRLSLLFADISFLAITVFPLAWLGVVMTYNGSAQQFQRWLPWLLIIPILTNIAIWTNPLHQLWRGESVRDLTTTWFPISIYHYGFWFYAVHAPYSYLITLIAMVLLIRSIFLRERVYRAQLLSLLLAFLLPLGTDIMYVLGLSPVPHYNLAPVSFSISGLLVGWTLLGFRFLELSPIARDLVLENMQDLVIVLDESGRVVDLNPAARQRFFQEDGEIVGQTLGDLLPEQDELIARVAASSQLSEEVEVHHNGEVQVYEMLISPINRGPGGRIGLLLLLRDITGRKRAEDLLHHALVELQAQNEELNAYAHTVAHDLKSPLAVMVGYAEILSNQSEGAHRQYVERISASAMKLSQIIDDLLMLAQLRRQGEITLQPLEMGVIVSDAMLRLHAMDEFTQADITLPPSWPRPVGYAPWVEEVWANYLSNALKYGGQPPEIELGWDRQGEMLRFWVRDNGPGLSADSQLRLFKQFERLDTHRSGSYGLGLSIVRRIAARLGGEAGVESSLGSGSRFFFTLPSHEAASRGETLQT